MDRCEEAQCDGYPDSIRARSGTSGVIRASIWSYITAPLFLVTGTTDCAYPLDSCKDSYTLVGLVDRPRRQRDYGYGG